MDGRGCGVSVRWSSARDEKSEELPHAWTVAARTHRWR